ncbi:GNAT family N-acetyltransferase [Actinoplanes sp. TFC3]|uniref:GNAT family N-acetyltransferase n=1 Tax=Actinoplanes sp. TFC3 TaxID=1710355 RepID=UPI00083239F1|nr:GNAT family N-acetyltransferase [Actinoplanes sp. TFC3]
MIFDIAAVNGEQLLGLQERLHPIYRQCFAGPPWNESLDELDGYPARLARQAAYPGAYGLVASIGGVVAGAVYGWPAPAVLPSSNAFDLAVRAAAPAEVARLLVAPAVVVAELTVTPAHRRRGLARSLLRRFGAGAPRGWLAAHPRADAVRFYEAEGWKRQFTYEVDGRPLVLYTAEFTPAVG